MKDYHGRIESKIWLIGDSPPENWREKLRYPLDPHHPAIHNIWTPALSKINDYLFDYGFHLRDDSLYTQNAVNRSNHWELKHINERKCSIILMKQAIQKHKPAIVISFGSRAYEATRQALFNDDESNMGIYGFLDSEQDWILKKYMNFLKTITAYLSKRKCKREMLSANEY